MSLRPQQLANAALFQAAWFACVLEGSLLAAGLSLLVVILFLATARRRLAEAGVAALIAGTGILHDSLLTALGLFEFGTPVGMGVPIWLALLWICFASLPGRSLAGLAPYPALTALLGALAGPASYAAGSALGDLVITTPGYLGLTVFWAVFLPITIKLAVRAQRVAPGSDPDPDPSAIRLTRRKS